MGRDIRFCTTDDGVSIAYCTEGDGPDLVCCPDFIGSFSLDHLIEDQMGFWRALWRGRRVVRYDMRGTGLSQRDVEDVSHDATVRDLDAVVRASGAHEFTLYASTLSGPRAITYSATHPQDVRRLVLHRTFARASDVMSREQFETYAALARVNWPNAAQLFADLPVRQQLPEAGVHQAQLYVQSTSGNFVARLLLSGLETTDVTPLLSQLRVPALVLHRRDDPMISFRLAQGLAAAIPQARLIPLTQGILSYLAAGRIDDLLSMLNEFIDDGSEAAAGSVPPGAGEATMKASPAPARSFASGRYAVQRVLGEGGQKVVYLVHDEALDRECALSMIKSELLDPDDVLRLRREAQAMARLGVHSNIVSVFDFGEEDGRPYLVCEYVPGGDLRQELRSAGGSLPLERALALAVDIARALAIAHGRGVVHRDLKPANVWLRDNGGAKLGDFGLAFSLDRSRLTTPGTVMGTAAYLSPEQALGEPVTERSDLYALGCLLYEMVCGRPPFADANATAVIAQHLNAVPAAPSSHEPDVPPALDALILRLLAKLPAQRPESASAVLEELRRIGDSAPAHTDAVASPAARSSVMTEPEIRYTTTADGVSIAYYTMGEGHPLVVTSTVLWSHLRLWPFPEYHRGGKGLGRGLQIVRYDARGTGLSDRHALDFGMDARLLDLEAVVERLKLRRFAIFAPAHGAPAAIAYAAAHPERVSHLVLANVYARGRDWRDAQRSFDSMRERADEQWDWYTLAMANANFGFSDSESARKRASLYRESMTPESVRAFYAAHEVIDVTPLLPHVAVPTLVTYRPHSGNSLLLESSREVASKIPDARFVTFTQGGDPWWKDEQTRVVEDFLGVNQDTSGGRP